MNAELIALALVRVLFVIDVLALLLLGLTVASVILRALRGGSFTPE